MTEMLNFVPWHKEIASGESALVGLPRVYLSEEQFKTFREEPATKDRIVLRDGYYELIGDWTAARIMILGDLSKGEKPYNPYEREVQHGNKG